MRILLIESNLYDNGAIRISLERARRWLDLGAEVTVLVVRHSEKALSVRIPDGLKIKFATETPVRLPFAIVAALRQAMRLASHVDVIVAGREIGPGILIAAITSWIRNRPFSVTVQNEIHSALRNYVPAYLRRPTIWAHKSAKLAVCTSSDLKTGIRQLGVKESAISVVINGLDFDELISLADEKAKWLPPPETRFIVSTGRLAFQKGFDVLIRAHALALHLGAPPHNLVILGEGSERPALEKLAGELGVSGSVLMPGFVANPHPVVKRADAFILSSRWEGFGLSLAEALCLGVPLIASNCISGPAEILQNGEFGNLVPPEDVQGLAQAINAHLNEPLELKTRSERGRLDARKRFDPTVAAQNHLSLLKGIVPP